MRRWRLITFISWCNPWLFRFRIEIIFTSAPSSNMTICIKFLRTSSITIIPEWFLPCDELPWHSVKVKSIGCNLRIIIITWMCTSIWLSVSIIRWSNPRLCSLIVEIVFVFCPECLIAPSIELFSSSAITVGPEWFDSLVKPIWFWLILSVPGWFLC